MHLAQWAGFGAFILAALVFDLKVAHRDPHKVSLKEAGIWSAVWIALGLSFTFVVHLLYARETGEGGQAALMYVTGYLVEKSLSLDNIFVISMILSHFRVPQAHRHRLLFLGILGALVLRGLMIAAGAALIAKFSWVTYLFGGILIVTAAKMALMKDDSGFDPGKSAVAKAVKLLFPVQAEYEEGRFLSSRGALTPLAMALVVIETSDVVFAVDSIPAVFAVTTDPFLVFTSNVFAILGLRSLFFVVEGFLDRFRYLKPTLVLVLGYIGAKMLLAHVRPIPPAVSLAVIAAFLTGGMVTSWIAGSAVLPAWLARSEALRAWARGAGLGPRRVAMTIVGLLGVSGGLVLAPLPIVGLLLLAFGIGVLAVEYAWARRALAGLKGAWEAAGRLGAKRRAKGGTGS